MDIYNQLKMIIGTPSGDFDILYILSCAIVFLFIVSLFKIIIEIFKIR